MKVKLYQKKSRNLSVSRPDSILIFFRIMLISFISQVSPDDLIYYWRWEKRQSHSKTILLYQERVSCVICVIIHITLIWKKKGEKNSLSKIFFKASHKTIAISILVCAVLWNLSYYIYYHLFDSDIFSFISVKQIKV